MTDRERIERVAFGIAAVADDNGVKLMSDNDGAVYVFRDGEQIGWLTIGGGWDELKGPGSQVVSTDHD